MKAAYAAFMRYYGCMSKGILLILVGVVLALGVGAYQYRGPEIVPQESSLGTTSQETITPIPSVPGAIVPGRTGFARCIPAGRALTDVVRVNENRTKTTVQQELTTLGAGCVNGKLVDRNDREIRFYDLVGCWGNPPPNYQETLARQEAELAKLKKQYTVIEMTCNPSGADIQ